MRVVQCQLDEALKTETLDLANIEQAFVTLKSTHKQAQLWRLIREEEDYPRLGNALGRLIRRMSSELASGALCMDSAEMPALRTLFNALALALGSDESDSVLSRSQLKGLKASLHQLHKALMERVFAIGLPRSLQANGDLLILMTWVTHGLKRRVLPAGDELVGRLFTQGLAIVANWPAASGEKTGPVGEFDRLDTRQLGKVMVHINTPVSQHVLDVDGRTGAANRAMLAALVLRLCGGSALDQCFLWPPSHRESDEHQVRQMIPIAPQAAMVNNIGNTIKDFLDLGILRLSDPGMQDIVAKLCVQMRALSPDQLFERRGQGLGNCANFLRMLFEVQQRPRAARLADPRAWTAACLFMLRLVAARCGQADPAPLSVQVVINVFSFGKSMSRTGAFAQDLLQKMAQALCDALPESLQELIQVEHLTGLLAALQHYAQCGLLPATKAHALMDAMFTNLLGMTFGTWNVRACGLCLRAAVYRHQSLLDDRTNPAWQTTRKVMQDFLQLGQKIEEDRLPCVLALVSLIVDEPSSLSRWQGALQRLSGLTGQVSLQDARELLARLQAKEIQAQAIEFAPSPDEPAVPEPLPPSPPSPPASPSAPQPRSVTIPGLTRVLRPTQPARGLSATAQPFVPGSATVLHIHRAWREAEKTCKPMHLPSSPGKQPVQPGEEEQDSRPAASPRRPGPKSKKQRRAEGREQKRKARAASRQNAPPQVAGSAGTSAAKWQADAPLAAQEFMALAKKDVQLFDARRDLARMNELALLYPHLLVARDASRRSPLHNAILAGNAPVSRWLSSERVVRRAESLLELEASMAINAESDPAVKTALSAYLMRLPLWEAGGQEKAAILRMAASCGLEHVVQTGPNPVTIRLEFLRVPVPQALQHLVTYPSRSPLHCPEQVPDPDTAGQAQEETSD